MSDEVLYRFEMQYVSWDNDPYYIRGWDNAKPITVLAANKADAESAVWEALGVSTSGRFWTCRVVSITDHRIPAVTA